MNNWKPSQHYTPSRLGVDGIVCIEVCAFALIAFVAAVMGYI